MVIVMYIIDCIIKAITLTTSWPECLVLMLSVFIDHPIMSPGRLDHSTQWSVVMVLVFCRNLIILTIRVFILHDLLYVDLLLREVVFQINRQKLFGHT